MECYGSAGLVDVSRRGRCGERLRVGIWSSACKTYFSSASSAFVLPSRSDLNVSVFSRVRSSFICARSSSSIKSSGRWVLAARLVREDLKVEGAHPAVSVELFPTTELSA